MLKPDWIPGPSKLSRDVPQMGRGGGGLPVSANCMDRTERVQEAENQFRQDMQWKSTEHGPSRSLSAELI